MAGGRCAYVIKDIEEKDNGGIYLGVDRWSLQDAFNIEYV